MNEMNRVRVEDASQVGEVRRLAASMARRIDFDEVRVEHVSIVVTELATNLVKHAGGGDLLLRLHREPESPGIDLLSLDKGPGIVNIVRSMNDGYSTSHSPGTGLGAIQRLSTMFDIYSKPGAGTAVLSVIGSDPRLCRPQADALETGIVNLPVATEQSCGDGWAMHQTPERALIMIADGLGHGEYAAEASAAAVAVFAGHCGERPKELLERMHASMRSTRGAAVAVAEILWGSRTVRYAGVGNISARILADDGFHSMVSHNGTLGMEARKIEELVYEWPANGLLIMYSDGISSHWTLNDYPGLSSCNAAVIAGVLFRDHRRVRDDATLCVMREKRIVL